jgi:hypothetical protein
MGNELGKSFLNSVDFDARALVELAGLTRLELATFAAAVADLFQIQIYKLKYIIVILFL